MVKAVVFLAPGFEEIEASTIVDVLRRCGVGVTIAGLTAGLIEGSHGIKFASDIVVENLEIADYDAVICPGGAPGYENLMRNTKVIVAIKKAFKLNKLVAAICAAPAVLSKAGVLEGKDCTIYPGMESDLLRGGGKPMKEIVVVDGNVITSMGPATALPFALELAARLVGPNVVKEVKERTLTQMVLK